MRRNVSFEFKIEADFHHRYIKWNFPFNLNRFEKKHMRLKRTDGMKKTHFNVCVLFLSEKSFGSQVSYSNSFRGISCVKKFPCACEKSVRFFGTKKALHNFRSKPFAPKSVCVCAHENVNFSFDDMWNLSFHFLFIFFHRNALWAWTIPNLYSWRLSSPEKFVLSVNETYPVNMEHQKGGFVLTT